MFDLFFPQEGRACVEDCSVQKLCSREAFLEVLDTVRCQCCPSTKRNVNVNSLFQGIERIPESRHPFLALLDQAVVHFLHRLR